MSEDSTPKTSIERMIEGLNPFQKMLVQEATMTAAELGKKVLRGPVSLLGEEKILVANTFTSLVMSMTIHRAVLGGEKPDVKSLVVMCLAVHDLLFPGICPFRLPSGEGN